MSNSRVEFIDLAKGICIIIVVVGHCGVFINIPGFEIVRVPLYFALSGLFYKDYGSGCAFLIKKINNIIIPFLFFYLLSYVIFYFLYFFAKPLLITDSRGIFDLFNNRQFFNGPIWFLLALFWCNIYYFLIESFCEKLNISYTVVKLFIIILLGVLGWYLGYNSLFLPLFLDVALTSLPFFYMGVILKRTLILYPNNYDKYNWIWFTILYILSIIILRLFHYRLSLHYNIIEGISVYIISGVSVLAILILCKMIKYLPIVSYSGRYSLILLCTHHLYYRPIKLIINKFFNSFLLNSNYFIAFVTLVLSLISIPIFIKYIPWFVAQKELLIWNPNKKS